MVKDKMIGVVIRHDFDDYEIMLTDFTKEDDKKLWDIVSDYADDGICGQRGDRHLTLEDCNVAWLEETWKPMYRNTANPNDIVDISTIFKRYVEINGTHKGFEEYVNSGFMNGNEKEYEEA